MTFLLKIETDNAAFADGNAASEVARILRETATKIESGHTDGKLRDSNGNTVGSFALEVADEDEDGS